MSLFSLTDQINFNCVHPRSVRIDGEVTGLFYSGTIEMKFVNDEYPISDFQLKIGQGSNNKIGFHNLKVFLDDTPYLIKFRRNGRTLIFSNEKLESDNNSPTHGIGDDNYNVLDLPQILQNQLITVSTDFAIPLSMISKDIIGLTFPLTCPSLKNSEILSCSDFKFSLQFKLFPLKPNSITSNPFGSLDLSTCTYTIDHLDPKLTSISITFDPNAPDIKTDIDQISSPENLIHLNDFAVCSGEYGTITFTPEKEKNSNDDFSGQEFIFIVDCSRSMLDNEIKLAAQCLIFFLKSLPEKCYFNIVKVTSDFVPLFTEPVIYSEKNVQAGIELAQQLKANYGCFDLLRALSYVFSSPLSATNKLRRVFVLTGGLFMNRNEIIQLIDQNTSTTMVNSIGIGYGFNRNLVQEIAQKGNGFYDFVLSGDDMSATVINQLNSSINGKCNVNVSIEGHENIEIISSFTNGVPSTFYFKSDKDFSDDSHVLIDIEGNSEKKFVQMKSYPKQSKIHESLEFLFDNENIKKMTKLEKTVDIRKEILRLSVKNNIITNYARIVGDIERKPADIKKIDEVLIPITVNTSDGKNYNLKINPIDSLSNLKKLIETETGIRKELQSLKFNDLNIDNQDDKVLKDLGLIKDSVISIDIQGNEKMEIFVHTLNGKHVPFEVKPSDLVEDFKQMIQDKEGFSPDEQTLIFAGKVLEDNSILQDYHISKGCEIHMSIHKSANKIPMRICCAPAFCENLLSIAIEQQIDGSWNDVPSAIKVIKFNDQDFISILEKIKKWADSKNFDKKNMPIVVGTLITLIFFERYMKETHDIWRLMSTKALKALNSIDSNINWIILMKSMI